MLKVCGVGDTGFQILACQVGKILKYLLLRHFRVKIFEDFVDSDPQGVHTELAPALRVRWLYIAVVHVW